MLGTYRISTRLGTIFLASLLILAVVGLIPAAFADDGGCTNPGTSTSNSLNYYTTFTGYQDYVAAGVGMRGTGNGNITISGIPGGSAIISALLYWAIVDDQEGANFKYGLFNGNNITGVPIGTDDDPCWTPQHTYAYRADVTSYVTGNGNYSLTGFASGPSTPVNSYGDPITAPLCEGASLVVVYSNAALPANTVIKLYEGADTVEYTVSAVSTTITVNPIPTSPKAKTTYIVADGQGWMGFDDYTKFNNVTIAQDTSTTSASFDGSDGGLWDTDTYDVSSLVTAGDTSVTVEIGRPSVGDCMVHVAQVFMYWSEEAPGVPEFGLPAFLMLSLTVVGLMLFRRLRIPTVLE